MSISVLENHPARARWHRNNPGLFLLLYPVLMVLSCATSPAKLPHGFEKVETGQYSSSDPGSLLEAGFLRTVPASEEWLMLAAASPWLIGTEIKMDVLKKEGYAAWRTSRLPTLSEIQSVRIVFTARRPEGSREKQSGTVFVPVIRRGRQQKLSWVIFAKGTEIRRDFTPSRGKGRELPFITALAALGYAVWVPDYSGMGDGQGIHDYCVAESLADSALDGLAAARRWLGKAMRADGRLAYAESGRLAIIGYSEGGLTVMGAIKAIAEDRIPTPGLRLEVAYPMGAPLNLAIEVPTLGNTPLVISHPEYQVFLGLGWARTYPEESKPDDIFSTRTIDRIVPLFDGTRSDVNINRRITMIVGKKAGSVTDADIFSPEYLSALRRNPASSAYYRVQIAARLDNWTPPQGIPIILAATPSDDIVPFANSQNEYDWASRYSPLADVTLVRLASKGHIVAGAEAFLYAIVDLDRREARAKAASSL
jgi:hypothetical protein